jgi:hypothetical protein
LREGDAADYGPSRSMPRALALWLLGAGTLTGCSSHIGSSCTFSTDCSARGDRLCDTSQPSGYCTVFNCGAGTCPDHAACVTFNAGLTGCGINDYDAPDRTARTLCAAHCDHDSDCRSSEGYVCADPREAPWSAAILDNNQNELVGLVAASTIDAGGAVADAAICHASIPRAAPEASPAEAAPAEAAPEGASPEAAPGGDGAGDVEIAGDGEAGAIDAADAD